ncbi:MAG: DUF3604 domain-containing protein [Pseudomonadota bacterium]
MRNILLVSLLLFLFGCADQAPPPKVQAPAADDYMTAELRDRVERLKRDLADTPTNPENQRDRANILFDWVNAWAMTGKVVPVNVTAVVSSVNAYNAPSGPALDAFITELAMNDENPRGLGEFTADPLGPFTVREYATFTQTYTVGEFPVTDGGGFLVSKHFQTNHPLFQATDPTKANYVSISSSNPAVTFTVDAVMVPGMHGGFRGAEGQLVFRVRGGTLNEGDTVTITYGDTSGGGRGLLMPDFSSDQMPFPVYVALDKEDLWLSLPIQPIQVIGSSAAGVAGFAPSIVATGETVEVSIRAEDHYGNRAMGGVPDWQIVEGNKVIASVAADGSAVVTTRLTFDRPGVHRLQVRSNDGSLVGHFNPVLVEDNPGDRVYWGDTHGHSGFSEGIGSADAYMRFARDEARLDFVTHSEHDIWMDDSEWETLRSLVQKYNEPGRFAAYLGYEWTVNQSQGGHHNVLYRTPENRNRTPSQHYPTLSSLYQGLRTNNKVDDVLIIPHAHQRGEYRYSDPEMETLIEIMSMHGTFEWFGRMYLNHGHEVGFVAASDDHIGRPGYAAPKSFSLAQRNGLGGVFAKERTSDAIFDAMKSLRAYATTGQRIIVNMDINGTGIGQRAPYADMRTITGRVIGTSPVRSVTLFKNDNILQEWQYISANKDELALSFYSESYPYNPQDNPRGWRHWRGTMEVVGGSVESAVLVDLQNLETQNLERNSDNPNKFTFMTNTRGDHSTIKLKMKGLSNTTRVRLTLADAAETGSGPPLLRRHQMIPGQSLELRVADMKDNAVTAAVPFDGYKDSIRLERGGTMPLEVDLSYVDETQPRHGDYYFLRVRQDDEGLAWTSPIWVGGSPPR